ncbi:MAG: hypothetical protein KDA56_02765 [Hyphomonas sp.]|nr:hypothetical protein [Hyphomonas sp.]
MTDNLRVYLASFEWMPGQKTERAILKPVTHASGRLAAACDGRAAMPEHLRTLPPSPTLARANAGRPLALASPRERGLHLPLAET